MGGDRGLSDIVFTSTGMKLVLAMVGGGSYCSWLWSTGLGMALEPNLALGDWYRDIIGGGVQVRCRE